MPLPPSHERFLADHSLEHVSNEQDDQHNAHDCQSQDDGALCVVRASLFLHVTSPSSGS